MYLYIYMYMYIYIPFLSFYTNICSPQGNLERKRENLTGENTVGGTVTWHKWWTWTYERDYEDNRLRVASSLEKSFLNVSQLSLWQFLCRISDYFEILPVSLNHIRVSTIWNLLRNLFPHTKYFVCRKYWSYSFVSNNSQAPVFTIVTRLLKISDKISVGILRIRLHIL